MNSQSGNSDGSSVMVAISYGNQVRLWGVSEQGSRTNIGNTLVILNNFVTIHFYSNFFFIIIIFFVI